MDELFTDAYFMKKALDEAQMAYENEEIPIGAIVVFENKIIGKGHNQTEKLTDVTAHAEMLAITAASSYMNSKFLDECTLYVTIEPCLMCCGAIGWSRLKRVVFGAAEPKFGYSKHGNLLPAKTELTTGILEKECRELMKQFFAEKRD
ncbi:MAG: nucleoside deaminase [Bacteroidetes bacterium]|nr:nucleoside deaminase [Bacteroidota bacterium]